VAGVVLAAGVAVAQPDGSARAAEAPNSNVNRVAIARMAIGIDQALRQVSRPSPLSLFGPAQTTRGYRIPGIGIFFVAPARVFPSLPMATRPPEHPATEQPPARVARPQTAARSRARVAANTRTPSTRPIDDRERALREVEEQARLMNEAALRMHREVEQLFDSVMKGASGRTRGPVPQVHMLPPMPPWLERWDETPQDTRTPGQVLDDVRAALGRVLAEARPLDLKSDESFVVTVDFFDDVALDLTARPAATLVVRVKAGQLDPDRKEPLSPAEIQERVEYTEFE
jgi:hypothetical protein